MLYLHVIAPFATFRTFSAGSYRPTAGFITYSAAYGLLLNIAGIEMRQNADKSPATLIKRGLPSFNMALGAIEKPCQQTIYQQLHNYPVGNTNKEKLERTKYNKNNIAPSRRTFLSNLNAYICIKDNDDLELKILDGLAGKISRAYGLPFLGDNSFLLDKLEVVKTLQAAYWFVQLKNVSDGNLGRQIERLTIAIDRANMAYNKSALFSPTVNAISDIPEEAWVKVGY